MKRFALLMIVLAACDKPSEDSCHKAIANMKALLGTANLNDDAGLQAEIRRCKGSSSKKSVQCAINATSLDALRACGFTKIPAGAGTPPSAGSALPPASPGSATPPPGPGSAPPPPSTGSAAPPPSTGSGSATPPT